MPATIWIDYDNVALFQEYAVPGAKLEFIVLVANQYGKDKVNVYGFGSFPEIAIPEESTEKTESSSPPPSTPEPTPAKPANPLEI